MKTILFRSLFPHVEEGFGLTGGGKIFGHQLLYPSIVLRQRLENAGWKLLSPSNYAMSEADIVVCLDITPALYEEFKSTKTRARKILVAVESPIYAPLSHTMEVLANPIWHRVMTWNRGFDASHILHFDIALAGIQTVDAPGTHSGAVRSRKGVAVSRYKNDAKGDTPDRDALLLDLARRGEIDLYGRGWPPGGGVCGGTADKLACISGYTYALVSENCIYDGYVTEKLPDCILAGIPAIYYGDHATAERRFPGTFIPLDELTVSAFLTARDVMRGRYDDLLQSVRREQQRSVHWCDSYIEAFFQAIA